MAEENKKLGYLGDDTFGRSAFVRAKRRGSRLGTNVGDGGCDIIFLLGES